jgi:hypothetical protein
MGAGGTFTMTGRDMTGAGGGTQVGCRTHTCVQLGEQDRKYQRQPIFGAFPAV